MQYMKASSVIDFKECRDDGTIVQMVVWQLLQADAERPHGLKIAFTVVVAGNAWCAMTMRQARAITGIMVNVKSRILSPR